MENTDRMSAQAYKQYKKIRDLTWQLLIDFHITELPVQVAPIIRQLGIGLYTYRENRLCIAQLGLTDFMEETDGFAMFFDGKHRIFYDDSKTRGRIRFTLAHELGHILCDPAFKQMQSEDIIKSAGTKADALSVETQANMFAVRLLAPACVLHELGLATAQDIARVCDLSLPAAEFRLRRHLALEERNRQLKSRQGQGCYYISSLEKQVQQQFAPYINSRSLYLL